MMSGRLPGRMLLCSWLKSFYRPMDLTGLSKADIAKDLKRLSISCPFAPWPWTNRFKPSQSHLWV